MSFRKIIDCEVILECLPKVTLTAEEALTNQ